MSRVVLTNLDLAQNQLENARIQNLGSQPGTPAATPKGVIYYNSTDNTLYWNDGTAWQAAKSGVPAAHASSHNFGGGDAIAANGAAGTPTLRKIGTGATDAAAGDHNHSLSTVTVPTADVSWANFKITNLGAGAAATDAVNKGQLDSAVNGLAWKDSVRVATTANITTSANQTIDGVVTTTGDRVLVKNQSSGLQNGIYVTAAGAWPRATDADGSGDLDGAAVFVEEGTTQADTAWNQTVNDWEPGTSAAAWVQFGAPASFTAGGGIGLTGTTFSVAAGLGIVQETDGVAVNYSGSGGDLGSANTVARHDHAHAGLYPPVARSIATTLPLTGGGDLSANRTLAINNFAGSAAGAVPVSVGGTTNFLRADGSWSPPPTSVGTVTRVALGCAAATSTVVSHTFGLDCIVQVYRNSTPWDQVECDVEHTSTTSVTVRFATAPAANAFRIVVLGA